MARRVPGSAWHTLTSATSIDFFLLDRPNILSLPQPLPSSSSLTLSLFRLNKKWPPRTSSTALLASISVLPTRESTAAILPPYAKVTVELAVVSEYGKTTVLRSLPMIVRI